MLMSRLTYLPCAHRYGMPPRRAPDTSKRDGNAAILTAQLSDVTWQRETCRRESPGCTHWSPAVSECVPCSAPCSPTGWCCTPTSPPRTCGTVWSAGAMNKIAPTPPPKKTTTLSALQIFFTFTSILCHFCLLLLTVFWNVWWGGRWELITGECLGGGGNIFMALVAFLYDRCHANKIGFD